jgi:hypothetical protein
MRRFASLLAAVGLGALLFVPNTASAAPPTILRTTVSSPTATSIVLEAQINPGEKATNYHFEYGPADCTSNPCTKVPAPAEGTIPKGNAPVTVSAPIAGLSPGTAYHLRVVAKNATPATVEGPDRTFMTYLPSPGFGACANDPLRLHNPAAALIEFPSSSLPDCRAYEQATPLDKGAGDAGGLVWYERASTSGDGVLYLSASGVPGGIGSQEFPSYLAAREGPAWSSRGLLPSGASGQKANPIGWTPDFSVFYTEALKLGTPAKTALFETPASGGPATEIVPYTPELEPFLAGTVGAGDLALFESHAAIAGVQGAQQGKSNLYLWDRASKTLRLAGVMNDGAAPPKGAFAGSYDWLLGTNLKSLSRGGSDREYYTQDEHVISADGSAVYFTAAGSGQLYLRQNPSAPQSALDSEGNCTEPEKACTVAVNATQKTNGPPPLHTDPAGPRPAAFQAASADGSLSFFTSTEKLTNDANTGPEQEPAAIQRSNLEGEEVDTSCLPVHATGIAVDSGHIYWANSGAATIGRADLGCDEFDDAFIATGPGSPQYVAVDAGHIYWTNDAEGEQPGIYPPAEGGTIGRADIDGDPGSVKADFITGLGAPQGIAVDANYIYWGNAPYADEAIARADIDGENADFEFHQLRGSVVPRGVAVDSSQIYWAAQSDTSGSESTNFSFIERIEVAGSPETLLSLGGGLQLRGLAIDADHAYFASQGEEAIGRIDLDLSEASLERKFIETDGAPDGVAVDSSNVYWAVNGNSPPNPGNDLYRYDAKTKTLSDLAPDHTNANGTEVRGLLGASEDGSYVYFAANGVPDGVLNSPNGRGESAEAGSCPVTQGDTANDNCSLYLAHNGAITFIARLESGGTLFETDAANWAATPTGVFPCCNFQMAARVSADGQTLLFRSQRQLSDYPNDGKSELYRYQVGGSEASCVSCNPTGAASASNQTFFGSLSPPEIRPKEVAAVLSHNLSADGNRVFFQTTDALVGADTNGNGGCPPAGTQPQNYRACTDVYEWEAAGTGSCKAAEAVAQGGCIYLISTGKGTEPALIADASADGSDVFFFSRSRLVGQDQDGLLDVYDARVEGGLFAQNQPPAPPPCEGEAGCRAAASPPPPFQAPPEFIGPSNPTPPRPCPKGKRRVKGRCVAKHHKGQHHTGNGHHKQANSKRRAGH